MEKNINMQNVDELCIKYVLNELDASELAFIEQAMREDANVLIEVESLRSTLRKLDKLPNMAPPTAIQEKVRLLAQESAQRRIRARNVKILGSGLLAAAAVVLGFGLYFYPSNALETSHVVDMSESVQPVVNPSIEQHEGQRLTVSDQAPSTEPWVDRQNIIRLNISVSPEGFIQMGTDHQHVTNSNGLKPIQEPSRPSAYPVMRDIQLTRTNN